MERKKYDGYKPKHEHYSMILYKIGMKVGYILDFVYEDGRCGMNHYYWGSEMDFEYNRHGEVEHNYIWDEENTKKLMLWTGTKNGKTLVEASMKDLGNIKVVQIPTLGNGVRKKGSNMISAFDSDIGGILPQGVE